MVIGEGQAEEVQGQGGREGGDGGGISCAAAVGGNFGNLGFISSSPVQHSTFSIQRAVVNIIWRIPRAALAPAASTLYRDDDLLFISSTPALTCYSADHSRHSMYSMLHTSITMLVNRVRINNYYNNIFVDLAMQVMPQSTGVRKVWSGNDTTEYIRSTDITRGCIRRLPHHPKTQD
jgi:hypothetical protein